MLDENLKEINLKSPLSVPAAEYAQLKTILENDTSELLGLARGCICGPADWSAVPHPDAHFFLQTFWRVSASWTTVFLLASTNLIARLFWE